MRWYDIFARIYDYTVEMAYRGYRRQIAQALRLQPGEAVQSDAEIDTFIRANVESAYHPSCSCKMGEDDMAVVNSDTQVRGIQGLRVVDSSIFPTIPNGNLNAPTIMVAERAADIIRGKGMLSPSSAEVGLDPGWKEYQRPRSPEIS